jgi:hypothetical protein
MLDQQRVVVTPQQRVYELACATLPGSAAHGTTLIYSAASLRAGISRAAIASARVRKRPAEKRHCSRTHAAVAF